MRIQYYQLQTVLGVRSFHTSLSSTCSPFSSEDVFSNKSRDKCISRIQMMQTVKPLNEKVRHRAAVLVPLVSISGEVHLLFTRRSLGMSFRSGEVCFPGGKQDPQDLDLTQTALRETVEELGISSSNVDVWCQMPGIYQGVFSSKQKGDFCVSPVVGVVRNYENLQLKPSRGEVSSVFTVPVRNLVNPEYNGYTQFRFMDGFDSSGYSLPVFHLQVPFVIWGITALITSQLLQALLPGSVYSHDITYQKPVI